MGKCPANPRLHRQVDYGMVLMVIATSQTRSYPSTQIHDKRHEEDQTKIEALQHDLHQALISAEDLVNGFIAIEPKQIPFE